MMTDRTLAELATLHTDAVSPDCALGEAAALMAKTAISCVLVTEDDRCVGIITEHDILCALRTHLDRNTPVSVVMSAPVLTARADLDFRSAYHLIYKKGVRHLLITSSAGQPMGIVSETDFRFQLGTDFLASLSSVEGLMNRRPPIFPVTARLDETLARMVDARATCALIVDNENRPLGIVTERDTVRLFSNGSEPPSVSEAMSSPVRTILSNSSMTEAALRMREEGIRHLAVIDGEGGVVGLLDEHDLLRPLELGDLDHFLARQKKTEQTLSETRANLIRSLHFNEALLEAIPVPVFYKDRKGLYLGCNPAFTELTGLTSEQIMGRSVSELWPSEMAEVYHQRDLELMENPCRQIYEFKVRDKHGQPREVIFAKDVFRDEHDQVGGIVGAFNDVTALKESQAQLEHLAFYDALTHLPNRRLLGDRLQRALAHAKRDGSLLAVCYLDLDEFKSVNDTLGHATGDHLLVAVTQRLGDCVRADDTLSRLGGDEFVVLLGDIANIEECAGTLSRILTALSSPFEILNHEIKVSTSIGVTIYPYDGADPDTLLRHADQALYAAKQEGRNRYSLFDTEHDRLARAHHEASHRIEEALGKSEFMLYFQPKANMRTGCVVGAEALIRWKHPERGLLPPAEFLPVIEETDFAATLGHWVLGEALREMSEWDKVGTILRVSVNISPLHLQQPDFASRLSGLLSSHPEIDPGRLELEILESTALDNLHQVSNTIKECCALGVSFALDDFGTGYSSLTYFRRLPARTLKIDQSFVRGMLEDPEDMAIVEGVIGLTKAFKREVIAEGVETSEHGILLVQLGCDLAQGYGIARPMPAEQIPDWMRNFKPDPRWTTCTAKKRK